MNFFMAVEISLQAKDAGEKILERGRLGEGGSWVGEMGWWLVVERGWWRL
jgi:hypothetical protein